MPRNNGRVGKRPERATGKTRPPGINEPQSAIALLKADHREVEGLFKSFKSAKSATEKESLASKICTALKLHTRIEEEIFYPAFIEATGDKELHNEALVEHQGAKRLIEEIENSGAARSVVRRPDQGAIRNDQAPCEGRGTFQRHVHQSANREDGLTCARNTA